MKTDQLKIYEERVGALIYFRQWKANLKSELRGCKLIFE